MQRIDKFLKKLPPEIRIGVEHCLNVLVSGKLTGLDIRKLKGKKDMFRVRMGSIRIIFTLKDRQLNIISIGRRNDNTYKL